MPPPQVNLALKGLPTFSCLPEDRGQHRTTTHLLPGDEGSVLGAVQAAFADVQAGRLPDFPTIEIYWQTTVDPSLTGDWLACPSARLSCRLKSR
jgi:phytoene dehydrogenase-like protein